MSEAPEIVDRDEQMLGRLAELDLAAAEKVHANLMAAQNAAEIGDLGRTYQRLTRSLRQTLALKARLKHERAQAEAKRRPQDDPRTPARKTEVREALARVVSNENEREDAEEALAEADDFIELESHTAGFLTDPIPTIVTRPGASAPVSRPPRRQDRQGRPASRRPRRLHAPLGVLGVLAVQETAPAARTTSPAQVNADHIT